MSEGGFGGYKGRDDEDAAQTEDQLTRERGGTIGVRSPASQRGPPHTFFRGRTVGGDPSTPPDSHPALRSPRPFGSSSLFGR